MRTFHRGRLLAGFLLARGVATLFEPPFFLLLPILLVSLGATFVSKKSAGRVETLERLPRLETAEPSSINRSPVRVSVFATAEALQKVDLCARVTGVVDAVPADVDIGAQVYAGKKLIQLHVPDLEALDRSKRAMLELSRQRTLQVEAGREVAARELREAEEAAKRCAAEQRAWQRQDERIAELVRRGAQQPERAEEARYQLQIARAAWQAAQAQVAVKVARLQAREADVRVAQSQTRVAEAEVDSLAVQVGYATVSAPFDGVITKRWVDQGAMIKDPSTPLLTVMRTDKIRVVLHIPERDVPLVSAGGAGEGSPVHLTFPGLRRALPNGLISARITHIASAVDPLTRTMRAEAHVDNERGHLRPGMSGTATLLLTEYREGHVVPSSAVLRRGPHAELLVLVRTDPKTSRGVVRATRVELGRDDGIQVQVHGLSGKERVITESNAGALHEGETVLGVPGRPARGPR